MFGDMFGNMEEKQQALQEKLGTIFVQSEAGEGAITVKANARREIINVSINKSLVDLEDMEQLEDLLLVAVNRALEMAAGKEAEESQKLIQDILPPGMDGLKNMFG